MSDYKYTSDGKKVVVVGKLNDAESIVQEIYVSGNSEMPSGQNFVVKSLHDDPVVSWKEERLSEIESKYNSESSRIDRELKRLKAEYYHESKNLKLLLKNIKQVSSSPPVFSTINQFLSGEITHLVMSSYDYEIRTFFETVSTNKDDYYDDDLKLISLFGRSDGNLEWRINRYTDNSGNSKECIPCSSFEQAVEELEKIINENISNNGVNDRMIKAKTKYNLSVPTREQISEFNEKIAIGIEKSISSKEAEIAQQKERVADLRAKR